MKVPGMRYKVMEVPGMRYRTVEVHGDGGTRHKVASDGGTVRLKWWGGCTEDRHWRYKDRGVGMEVMTRVEVEVVGVEVVEAVWSRWQG